jgi:hypothetical protein
MVKEPAGCGHKNIHPLSEGLFLGRVRDAPIDGSSREGRVQGEVTKMIRDLHRKLSCGDKDKGPRFSPGLADQPVENWKEEGGGLAASRHGRGHDIAALEKGWNGQLLDRRGLVKPLFLKGFQQMGVKRKR